MARVELHEPYTHIIVWTWTEVGREPRRPTRRTRTQPQCMRYGRVSRARGRALLPPLLTPPLTPGRLISPRCADQGAERRWHVSGAQRRDGAPYSRVAPLAAPRRQGPSPASRQPGGRRPPPAHLTAGRRQHHDARLRARGRRGGALDRHWSAHRAACAPHHRPPLAPSPYDLLSTSFFPAIPSFFRCTRNRPATAAALLRYWARGVSSCPWLCVLACTIL